MIKKGIPSLLTCLGLLSGCLSIVATASRGDLIMGGYFILAAAGFDFLDGMAARTFKSISEFGKQLDSLADMVSFGVAPALILYRLILLSYVGSSPLSNFDVMNPSVQSTVILYSSFLVAVFSALRLAKFNLDTEQLKNFRGLPTPANALFFVALGFISESSPDFDAIIYNRYFLSFLILLSCYLLVCNIRMFSLKFSSLAFKTNSMRYVFLLFAIVLLGIFQVAGLAPLIILYVLFSLINNAFVRMT